MTCFIISSLPFSQGIKLKIESSIETIETSSIDQLEKANEELDEVSLCDSQPNVHLASLSIQDFYWHRFFSKCDKNTRSDLQPFTDATVELVKEKQKIITMYLGTVCETDIVDVILIDF